jgi:hypothetical protein
MSWPAITGQLSTSTGSLSSVDATQAPVRVAPYQARPGRRVLVVLNLEDLRGPAEGKVELPLRLFWSGASRTFDLDDPGTRQWVYETVLQEASRPEDLTTLLDGSTLIALWPTLFVPRGVRRAWEDEHPALRAAAATAA